LSFFDIILLNIDMLITFTHSYLKIDFVDNMLINSKFINNNFVKLAYTVIY